LLVSEIHRIVPNDVQEGLPKSLRNKEGTVSDPNYESAALPTELRRRVLIPFSLSDVEQEISAFTHNRLQHAFAARLSLAEPAISGKLGEGCAVTRQPTGSSKRHPRSIAPSLRQ
jgi:hypothetical protein